MPLALVLLAAGGVAIWFGVARVRAIPSSKPVVEETTTAKPVAQGQAHGQAHAKPR